MLRVKLETTTSKNTTSRSTPMRTALGKRAKSKGNGFELLVGKELSKWISRGKRTDLFARNVLSGGKFTQSRRKGSDEGIAGDLMSAHPDSVEFAKVFNVECKHYADLGLFPFMFDIKGKSFLGTVVQKCQQEARQSGKNWVLVARQNSKPILVGLQSDLARAIIWQRAPAFCHSFRTKHYSVTFFLFLDLLANVKVSNFTKAGRAVMGMMASKAYMDASATSLWERSINVTGD